MRIKSIRVDNFKSLVNFELPLAKFSCLVGLNGSGKSTVLQFFDFLCQQFRGDLSGWLKKRQWEPSDLNSKLSRKQNVSFEVSLSQIDYDVDTGVKDIGIKWFASFNRQTLRCTNERIEWDNQTLLKVEDGYYSIWIFYKHLAIGNFENKIHIKSKTDERRSSMSGEIAFDYQGSLISQIKESQLPRELQKIKKFFVDLHALDLL